MRHSNKRTTARGLLAGTQVTIVVALLTVTFSGCASDAGTTASAGRAGADQVAASTQLAAGQFPDIDDRQAWRRVLAWSADCEQAFEMSHAADNSGLERYPMDNGAALIAVLCVAGSYQPSYLFYYVPSRRQAAAYSPLVFPDFVSADGQTLTPVKTTQMWGEPDFTGQHGELNVLRFARQSSDCGTWARYGVANGIVELREFRVGLPCPAVMQDAVDPGPGEAPAQWRTHVPN